MNRSFLSVLLFIQITLVASLPGPTISTSNNSTASSFVLSNGTKTHSRPPTTTPFTTYSSNLTGLGINSTLKSPICLFVVQDSVKIKSWANYHTWLWTEVFNVTSLVTVITKYVDTTVTNYDTKITPSTITNTSSFDAVTNKLVAPNYAPGPTRIINELNGTAFTSMGTTFTSPTPFYEYYTVKIISAPAITQMNGQIACVTAMSTWFHKSGPECETVSKTFSSINSVAQSYFDTSAVLVDLSLPEWHWEPAKNPPNNESFSVLHQLTLPTPFFHFPAWGVPSLEDNYGFNTSIEFISRASWFLERPASIMGDHGSPEFEDFGYVPQALVNFITQRPDITSRFPPGASFLPGGPSIIEVPPDMCFVDPVPYFLAIVPDITVHGESTIAKAGCFHPGACILQDSAIVTTTPIASVGSKGTPEPSATLTGAIAAETTFIFSTRSNFKENAPTTSSIAARKTKEGSGETIVPGPSHITITSGKTYSVDPLVSRISTDIVASALWAYETTSPILPSIVRVGLQGLPANDASESDMDGPTLSPSANGALLESPSFFVDATPLIPGANPITVSGTVYSLSTEATALAVNGVQLIPGAEPIIVSGVKYSLAPKATALTIDGHTRSFMSGVEDDGTHPADYAVDGTPLVPGAEPIIVSGTTYSLKPEATALAVNGVVLIPGSKPVVVSGFTYSLAPKATALSINGETRILSSGAQDSTTPAGYAVDGKPLVPGAKAITVSGITYSLAPKATALTVNDNTLIPGGEPIVASGTAYSLAPKATAIVINGVIKPLAQRGPDGSEIPRLTGYVIGNQTVVPGAPAITISGTSFSLTPKGNFLVVDNNTAIAFPTPAPKPGSQISFYLNSNQLVTASATLISDSRTSLLTQSTNDYYTTATSIKGYSFTVSATEGLNRIGNNSAILPGFTFTGAATGRRERLSLLGRGPLLIISLLAGGMFQEFFRGLGACDLI